MKRSQLKSLNDSIYQYNIDKQPIYVFIEIMKIKDPDPDLWKKLSEIVEKIARLETIELL